MAFFDPKESYEHIKSRTIQAVTEQFPIRGRNYTLSLEKVDTEKELDPHNIKEQYEAKTSGKSWSVPLYAHVKLHRTDDPTKVLETKKIRIAELPAMTNRFSYILDGQEYKVDNQWQLKPGAYTRRKQTGELETQFNVTGRSAFDMQFDPKSQVFQIEYKKAHIPAYPILKSLGVSDEQLESAWGKDILQTNKKANNVSTAVQKFYKTATKKDAPDIQTAHNFIKDTFTNSRVTPEVVENTLGRRTDYVDGDLLLRSTQKLLRVQSGHPEDDRDSLVFKNLRTAGDYVYDTIKQNSRTIKDKVSRQLAAGDKKESRMTISQLIRPDIFNRPVREMFLKSSISNVATQINPIEMVSSSQQTTIMGPGGIQSENEIIDDAKMINNSHFGFIDPVHTPEGCYDKETEVFTADGWKFWPSVTENDLFACLVNGQLEFHKAEALQAYRYKGKMYGGKRPWLSYLVTPEHRMLCRPRGTLKEAPWRVATAESIHLRSRLFPLTHAPYLGVEQTHFYLPFVEGNNSSKNVDKILLEDWAELLGWVLSEGNSTYEEETSEYHVYIHQSYSANRENCERIEALLNRLPFAWSSRDRGNSRMVFNLSTKQLAKYMSQFGSSENVYLPEEVFSWPLHARRVLLDTLMCGDGRQTKTHKSKRQDSEIYTTTSLKLAKGVERLIISLGHATSFHVYEDKREERYLPVYEICSLRGKVLSVDAKKGQHYTKDYDDMVYCATVPGTFLYVRRDNKHPFWCGNSRTGISLRLPLGVKRVGAEVKAPLYNLKTGALEMVNAKTFVNSNVVLPDEIKWVDGKPVPLKDKVKVAGKDNEFETMSMHKADYVMSHPSQFLNITTNLIPYFNSTNGNRTSMATRHLEQTISLKHREAPLVQVATGAGGNSESFEKYMANLTAHVAPVDGVVTAIKPDAIHLKTDDGKEHTVHLYNHFPLNDTKGMLHSTPLPSLKVGDKVKKDQFLADTNFTKDGQLAIGTNLRVAYMPFKGLNFEDGTVISETAAEKLTSLHLHKPSVSLTETNVLNKSRFQRHLGPIYNARQYNSLDDDGVVKVGTKIQPGDPLIATMRPVTVRDKYGLAGVRRTIVGEHVDGSLLWDHDHVGEVLSVHRNEKGITVHVKTEEKMQAGDKIAGRYGNKGIVVAVIPDAEMPKTKDGKPMEILLNPTGIPGRMNIGQVYETVMSKVAKKTGKPILVDNFEPHTDMHKKVTEELKKHGISDTEELIDPETGKSLGHALVGYQQINKLVHQVDKKTNVRSGMTLPNVMQGETYDNNLQPTSGKGQGGQSFGSLGVMAMLAHGAVHNLREAQSYKSEGEHKESDPNKKWESLHRQVWNTIQTGGTFPTPKPTFAFEKFTSYLKAAGVNMDKIGNEFVLSPMTDKQVLDLSKGRKIHDPTQMVLEKAEIGQNPRPVKGGLFDEKATGGHNGKLWSHIELAEPVPNPVFERPIQKILDLSRTNYLALVHGEKSLDANGKLIAGSGGMTGGTAIKHLLSKVNVAETLKKTEAELAKAPVSEVNNLVTKAKYLKALQQLKLEPAEAYVLHHLPVLPPVMRPIGVMQSGDLNIADMNELYKGFGQINKKLGDRALLEAVGSKATIVKDLRAKYYDGVRAILGVGVPYEDQAHKGLLHQIAGSSPKCFDHGTEVLTENGWVPFPAYDGQTKLGTVNLETGLFEWQAPQEYTVTHYSGQMLKTIGRDIDLLVTPNHSHVLSARVVEKGQCLWTPWKRVEATKLLQGTRYRMMVAAESFVGKKPQVFINGWVVPAEPFAKFVGWWLAEGWIGKATSGNPGITYLCQSERAGIQEIDSFLREMGLTYTRSVYEKGENKPVVYWSFRIPELTEWLVNNCGKGCENKFLSKEIMSWDKQYLLLLIQGYLSGDGEKKERLATKSSPTYMRSVGKIRGRFSTSSKELYNNLQQVCVQIGLRVMLRKPPKKSKPHHLNMYKGSILGFRDVTVGDCGVKNTMVPYSGTVYGPTVQNGTVVVRRNGIPAVSGNSGFFQDRLIERRQDLSARTTIIPEPSLGLDQVGIPKQVAIKLFEPFIIKKLKDLGYGKSALESQNELMKQTPAAWRALDLVMKEQPVLLKRDPVLHKYGIQGFKPVLSSGNAIQIHPLVCGGFNADFDGDSMGLFVPITKEAKDEAYRMMPSNNLFHDGHGQMMYQPTLEYSLGLHRLALVRKDSGKKFDTADKALAAAKAGELHYQDTFHLGDTKTTLGRVIVAAVVPPAEKKEILTNLDMKLNRKGVEALLTRIAKRSNSEFSSSIDQLKNLGSGASYGVIPLPTSPFRSDITAGHNAEIQKGIAKPDYLVVDTHTLGLKDFSPDYTHRNKHYESADKEVEKIKASVLPESVKKEKIVEAYQSAEKNMQKEHLASAALNPTNLFHMQQAGIKPQWEQYKQLIMAPGLLKDSKNNIILTPIKKSYAEGLNVAEYWTQMHGARRGTVMKVQEVQEPGYMTKLLVNSTMHMTIPEHDCGTQKGILMSVNDKEVFDRHLVKDVKIGNLHIPAGHVVTPDLVSQVKSLDKDAKLFVRSPLKCEHAQGICQKCAGLNSNGQLYPKGTNVGIIASQAVGERAVQLSMKEFHLGGAVKAGAPKIGAFEAFNRLVTLPKPKDSPEVAVLAMKSGVVDKIEPTRTGVNIHINGTSHFVGKDFLGQPLHDVPKDSIPDPSSTWIPPKVGMKVTAGQHLSDPHRTIVNPHTLYEATGSIETVQNHLVDEMHKLYKDEGIKRRHMETLVRAMSSVTKIEDPGDHETFLRGEFMPLQNVYKENAELQKAGKKQIQHTPVIKGIVDLPFMVHDDWMAKLQHAHLRSTIQEAAALGGRSNIHGSHPIPALAYGAEIGLNKENTKFKPIYNHLAKVEEHQY